MPAAVEPITTSAEWLNHLFAGCAGWLTLFSLDRVDGTQTTDWATVDQVEGLVELAGQRAQRSCVWFGVATRKERIPGRRRGGVADCLHIPALWVDIDVEGPNHKGGHPLPPSIEAAYAMTRAFPLEPTAVVRSGGGLQAWWLLHEPLDVDNATLDLLRAFGATWVELARRRSWHLDNVFDVARIMRLPGTWNRKNVPAPVTAKAVWERRYHPEDFEPHLFEPPAPPDPGPVRIPYIGPERPGDAFNAVRNGGDVLSQAGFTLTRHGGDEDHWTRPGKDPKDGTSATVYPDGHTTLWSDTITARWAAVELRRPYDPFGLYTVLFHGGDFTVASDELAAQGYGTKAMAGDNLAWIIEAQQATHDNGADQPVEDIQLARAVTQERLRRAARRVVDQEEQGADDDTDLSTEADPDIHTLLGQPEPEYRWLIPGLLERSDRVILTGPEGQGKTTLLRQMAVQAASGIHPFTDDDVDPVKVLFVDLENTRRQTLRELTPLVIQAQERLADNQLIPIIHPEGIDLLDPKQQRWLTNRVDANQPDLMVIGPLYKLALGDPTSEEAARHVAYVLDALRVTYDVALLIEAHQPHRSNGHRPERPYGASLWMRWPEFGLALTATGFLHHWRGARDERDWPPVLRRGGAWPWTLATAAQANFAALMDACRDAGEILSERELALKTGMSKTTIHRAIDANRAQWERLTDEFESDTP
jgi:hypothetical protein